MTVNARVKQGQAAAAEHETALAGAYAQAINSMGRRAARQFTRLTTRAVAAAAAVPDWTPPQPDELIDPQAAATGQKRAAALQKQILAAVVDPVVRDALKWDLEHPLLAGLLSRTGAQAERLTAGVRETVQAIVKSAYEDGLTVKQASAAIQDAVKGASVWQSEMLARTDLIALSNGGALASVRMLDASSADAGEDLVATKSWITASDEAVRPSHADAEGQTVALDETFDVGDDQLAYPGDPDGSDEETINCRCTLVFGEPLTASAATLDDPTEEVPTMPTETEPVTASVTITVDEPDASGEAGTIGWRSTPGIAYEGAAADAGRYFLPGCWGWRDLPLTLMAMIETADGHDGAQVAGRIETLEKVDAPEVGEGVVAVRAAGVFDAGEYGQHVARLVVDRTLRGISVDYSIEDYCFRDPATGVLYEEADMTEEQWMQVMMGDWQIAARACTIGMATVCPFPAFEDAAITVASAAAGADDLDPRVQAAIDQLMLVTQKERFEGYKLGLELGLLTDEDVRRQEGRPPRPALNGDTEDAPDRVSLAVVACLEGITERLAAGERLNESMVQALRELGARPPRKLTVERDADGHAVSYQEV